MTRLLLAWLLSSASATAHPNGVASLAMCNCSGNAASLTKLPGGHYEVALVSGGPAFFRQLHLLFAEGRLNFEAVAGNGSRRPLPPSDFAVYPS